MTTRNVWGEEADKIVLRPSTRGRRNRRLSMTMPNRLPKKPKGYHISGPPRLAQTRW